MESAQEEIESGRRRAAVQTLFRLLPIAGFCARSSRLVVVKLWVLSVETKVLCLGEAAACPSLVI